MKQSTRRAHRALPVAGMVCLCLLGRAAHGEPTPFRLGAGIAYDSDDNIFRAPDGQEVSDRYTTLSVFGGVDQPFGRQRLLGKVKASRVLFQDRNDLDHTAADANVRWTGQTVGPISWDLGYIGRRGLMSYDNVVSPVQRVPNVETNQLLSASLQLGMQAQWVAALNLAAGRIDETAVEFAGAEQRATSVGAVVLWNPSGPLTLSAGPRFTQGRYPKARNLGGGVYQEDEYDRRDIDFGAKYVVDGASTLNARVSLTKQTFDVLEDRDFEGATGLIAWTWDATAKTKFRTVLTRDTGSATSFFTSDVLGQSQRGTSDSSQYTNKVEARVDYEATAKITVGVGASYARRHLSSSSSTDGGAITGESGDERTTRVALGVRWTPTRLSQVTCDIGRDRRSTDTDLSSPFRATTGGCAAQIAMEL